jgi:endonuclease III
MQQLETRSDEELMTETRYRSAAQALLGARAAERYDAKATRAYYQRALAAARPQERLQLRRMADASIALAERRAGDLKDAVTRLGQKPPSDRQLLVLRFMGLIAPPASAGGLARLRGVALLLALVVLLVAVGFGIAQLVALPFGGVGIFGGVLLGLVIVVAVLGVLALLGRRRQARARAAAAGG